jgi:uncharacterized protein
MGNSESTAFAPDGQVTGGASTRRTAPGVGRAIVIMLGWMAGWWLLIGSLLAPVVPGGRVVVLAAAVVTAAPLLVLLRGFTRQTYPSAFVRVWVLRPFWYVQLGLPLVGISALAGVVIGLPFGAAATSGRWALLICFVSFAAVAVVGYIGSRRLVVRELETSFPDLPAALDGMRIVQISDLHVGPHTSRRHLARVAGAVRSARPDLIAITGDQVDDYAPDVAHFAAAFRALSAPHGVFAVAGNHDIYAGWAAVRTGLETMGVTVLVNDAVEVRRGDDRLWVAGTGDPAAAAWSRNGVVEAAPDVARTLARVPAGAFTVALAHNPVLWPRLSERGVQLTLSGHTHHGQLSIPRLGWSLASPFLDHAMGAHRKAGSLLYINPGTNYWGLPLRIGALPEVTVLTLRRSPDTAAAIEPMSDELRGGATRR